MLGLAGGVDAWPRLAAKALAGGRAEPDRRADRRQALGDGRRHAGLPRAARAARDCIAACHRVHNVPEIDNPKDEVKWIWKEHFAEAFPDQEHDYMDDDAARTSRCSSSATTATTRPASRVCPTQATWKREDGIVMMDWHRCIGCRYCVAACPYGSRSFNWRDPRPYIAEHRRRSSPRAPAASSRSAPSARSGWPRGSCRPASRPARSGCLVFGDLDDPDSEVRQHPRTSATPSGASPAWEPSPQVYYLV